MNNEFVPLSESLQRIRETQIDHIVEVSRRAADWLRKHPDRHISGELAKTKNGNRTISTRSSAHCFCFLGRVAKEAGLNPDETFFLKDEEPSITQLRSLMDEIENHQMDKLGGFFEPVGVTTHWLWTMNDADPGDKTERLDRIMSFVEINAKLKKGMAA